MNVKPFFKYCRERYQILLNRRAGLSKPWTRDKILQRYSFCNVRREDDKTTVWFREAFRSSPKVTVFSCVAFRFFSRISTGKILVQHNLLADWNEKLARKVLKDVHPLVTGAYIVKAYPGMTKLEGIIRVLRPVWKAQQEGLFDDTKGCTLERAHQKLMVFPYVGTFMAHEAIMDLRFTPILSNAPDWATWAAAGPGAARGLSRVTGKPLDHFNYHGEKSRAEMLELMRYIRLRSQSEKFWPNEFPPMDVHTVEFSLCEFDKFERTRLGEGRPKSLYAGL